jgi:probable HAF family extracellular repeat protein
MRLTGYMRKIIARWAWFGAVINAGIPVFAATFTVTSTNDVGPGTLRQAMMEANATNLANEIVFDIPGAGPHTLYLFTALPIITNSVIIDGFTQPGSKPNTRMYGNNSELMIRVDPSAQGFAGFHVQTNSVTIRGLSIIRSEVAAVYMQTGVSNVVEGCLFGTDSEGLLSLGGNPGYMAVRIANSSFNRIGGTNAWQHNMFAFGGGAGVGFFTGTANTNNAILGNSIFAYAGLGIDLEYDHRTLNDAGDADTGANQRQNFPVLTQVARMAEGTLIQGSLESAANGAYRLEFFAGPVSFRPDYGYARSFIGWTNVTTDGTGMASFSLVAPNEVPAGYFICSTATDAHGNTSEIGDSRQIPAAMYVAKPLASLGHEFTQGNDMNSLGDVVGFGFAGNVGTNTHAFLHSNGVMTDLGTLGGRHSFARALNDSRVVVGDAERLDLELRAFRWANGSMQDLGLLPGSGTYSVATDINNQGQIVGYSEVVPAFPGATRHAFLWQDNVMSDLGTLPGHFGSEAWAIDENGDIFGASWENLGVGVTGNYQAFIYRLNAGASYFRLFKP